MSSVYLDFEHFPSNSKESAVCLGNFDGLHRGHQVILKKCLAESKKLSLTPVLFTFSPHPQKILNPQNSSALLLTEVEKIELLKKYSFEVILNQSFTKAFSQMEPEDFVRDVLEKKLRARSIVVGQNFRFGRGAKGTPSFLSEKSFFDIHIIEPISEDSTVISSSKIRELIRGGQVKQASNLLGYPFFISGQVVKGKEKGKGMGYPTVNLDFEKECIPPNGVYLTLIQDEETKKYFCSVTNFGIQPTIDGKQKRLEAHLLFFKDDLYGRPMKLFFLDRIRDEKKFEDKEALLCQIRDDVKKSEGIFRSMKLMQAEAPQHLWSLKSFDPLTQSFEGILQFA